MCKVNLYLLKEQNLVQLCGDCVTIIHIMLKDWVEFQCLSFRGVWVFEVWVFEVWGFSRSEFSRHPVCSLCTCTSASSPNTIGKRVVCVTVSLILFRNNFSINNDHRVSGESHILVNVENKINFGVWDHFRGQVPEIVWNTGFIFIGTLSEK